MSPGGVGVGEVSSGFPRVSGDEPDWMSLAFAGCEFSPRERG